MNTHPLIEKYFEGSLSPKEQQEFEILLKKDSAFYEAFEFQKDVKKALIESKKDKLRKSLIDNQRNENKSSRIKYLLVASVVIALGVLSIVFVMNTKTSDYQQLYVENFEPYPNIIAPPVRGSDDLSQIQKDFMPYQKENYEVAVKIFEQRYQETNAPFYLFYQGVTALKLGNTDEAIVLFEKQIKHKDRFKNYSKWYLALAYLKKEDIDKTEILLNQIVDKQTYRYKSAQKLLEKIN
ncbi:MAG: hypothetical protein AAF688_10340 [Bacteroidota bacterium]